MSILNARYKVRLYDPQKTLVAEFDDWRSLQFFKRINSGGSFTLIINGTDTKTTLFESDGFLEIWRRVPGLIDWYLEYGGIVENFFDSTFENGNRQFVITGSGYTELLGRRFIMYQPGSITVAGVSGGALKSSTPGAVMREFVEENIGDNATIAFGRVGNGVIDNITYAIADVATPTFDGDRSAKNLLAVIQEIANFGGVDFEFLSGDPLAGVPTWVFRTAGGQIGSDRSTTGLDPTTGRNAAGNFPVIFSVENGNVSGIRYSVRNAGTMNVAFVIGTGVGQGLEIEERPATPTIGISRREGVRSARTEVQAGQQTVGDTTLEELQAEDTLEWDYLQQENTLYGLHFFLGDTVTGQLRFPDGSIISRDKRIVGVSATIASNGQENLRFDFADVP